MNLDPTTDSGQAGGCANGRYQKIRFQGPPAIARNQT
jgi:hypothetical protein